jgi:hypothetical protein
MLFVQLESDGHSATLAIPRTKAFDFSDSACLEGRNTSEKARRASL